MCILQRQGVRNFVVITFDLETANIVDSVCGPGYAFYDVAMLQGKKVQYCPRGYLHMCAERLSSD